MIGIQLKNGCQMENSTPRRILLLVTNPFAATNVFHSGLIKHIAKRYEVHILSDLIGKKEILEINQHFKIQVKFFPGNIPTENRKLRLLRKLEKAIFFKHFGIKSQIIKAEIDKSLLQHLTKAITNLLKFLNLNESILRLLRLRIIRQSSKSDLHERISALKFSGIISTSPLDIRENIVVNAMRKNLPSLAMVISWDNLTTKGLINADHDYVLVWNKFMAKEYCTFYGVFNSNEPKIGIIGVPRFDQHFGDPVNEDAKTAYRQKMQFNNDDRIILFATSAAKHFPDQLDIVYHLAEYAQPRPKVKLIIRCHPGDDPGRYRAFENHDNIRITAPEKLFDEDSSIPALNTLLSLSEVLKCTDVCIEVASTMRLDAAACNRPIISIAYDGNRQQPYFKSVRRFYDYDHQVPLNKFSIGSMVFTKQELFNALDKTLFHPKPEQNQNRELVKEFTHFSEPVSVLTTMKFIDEWLS